MCFLETFAMITLRVAQTKQSFLQEIVLLVPKRKGNVLKAVSIAHTGNAIFAPSISSGPCLVMGEMTPSISIVRVVLAYCCPLSFSNIRTPLLPVLGAFSVFFETLLLLTEVFVVVDNNHREGRVRIVG
jgi:hypothetical protein